MVRIAQEASAPPSSDRLAAAVSIPGSIFSIGRGVPIIPVEHTNTSRGSISRALATALALAIVSLRPFSPVQALALPEFNTTERIPVAPFAKTAREYSTGAAAKRLEVNTPAATGFFPVLRTSARSLRPLRRIPEAIPQALNPGTLVTPWRLLSFFTGQLQSG